MTEACTRCTLNPDCRSNCLMGRGQEGTIMLVNDCPSYNDDFEGVALSGRAGDLLSHILFKLGFDIEDVYVTNLIKCRPRKDVLPKGGGLKETLAGCISHLHKEIRQVKPKVLVPMGSLVTKELTGNNFITRVDGLLLKTKEGKAVACHGLAAALQSPSLEKNISMAISFALVEAGKQGKTRGKGLIFNYKLGGLE